MSQDMKPAFRRDATSGDPFSEKGLPANVEAERSILGAIMLDNAVCNQAMELLRREEFFLDSHRRIFERMVELNERGTSIDLVTLGDALRRAGEFEQVGGATFIASLMDGVPRTDSIEPYARIVKAKAMLRRLITASNHIIAMCFDEEDEPDVIIDRAEQMIFQIAEDRIRQGFQYIGDVAQRRLEEIEMMADHPRLVTGVPTGFADLDHMTSGLQRQDLILIAARPSQGKCLAYDSEILLADGGVATIAEIYARRRAELLTLHPDWRFAFVRPAAFVDDGLKPVYRVTTRLGRSVESTLTHPYLTLDGWRKLAELRPGDKIAVPRKLEVFGQKTLRDCEVKLLAYLIGDDCLTQGAPRFTNPNPALRNEFYEAVVSFVDKDSLALWLEEQGLWGQGALTRSVPPVVFKLMRRQLALFLNRLFATDGWVSINQRGDAEIGYATVSERLARQAQHLLLRFGVVAALGKRAVKYKDARREAWQLVITDALSIKAFASEIGIFGKEERLRAASATLERKPYQTSRDLIPVEVWGRMAAAKGSESWASLARRAGIKGHTNVHAGTRRKLAALATALGHEPLRQLAESEVYWDEIVAVEPAGCKQVYDLTIPETHNFVANDICVHNTALALNLAQHAAKEGRVVGIFSLEMSAEQLVSRLLCSEAGVDAHRLRTANLNQGDWARLADALARLTETQVYIDDTPSISVMEMRAKVRRLKAEHGLDLLIVDYLQLIAGRGRESRQMEVSQISRDLKGLARELDVPLIALSQLSRAPETRSDKRPQLSDLRDSGSLEQDADVVCFIFREEYYGRTEENRGVAELIISKQRNGPTGTVKLIFIPEYTCFRVHE